MLMFGNPKPLDTLGTLNDKDLDKGLDKGQFNPFCFRMISLLFVKLISGQPLDLKI